MKTRIERYGDVWRVLRGGRKKRVAMTLTDVELRALAADALEALDEWEAWQELTGERHTEDIVREREAIDDEPYVPPTGDDA